MTQKQFNELRRIQLIRAHQHRLARRDRFIVIAGLTILALTTIYFTL